VVAAADQVLSCDLGGEVAILNLKNGFFYGLNAAGACIWDLLRTPKTLTEIRDALLEEFEVEPDRCERDLGELLEQLASAELTQIHAEPPA
jgi:hypothetical protein